MHNRKTTSRLPERGNIKRGTVQNKMGGSRHGCVSQYSLKLGSRFESAQFGTPSELRISRALN